MTLKGQSSTGRQSRKVLGNTYDRWYSIYTDNICNLKVAIERLSDNQSQAFNILENNLNHLADMRYVYSSANTLQKREFVNLVFDSNLYYENGIYRTPTMLGMFTHNLLKMKVKRLLMYEKKRGFIMKPLSAEGEGFEPPDL